MARMLEMTAPTKVQTRTSQILSCIWNAELAACDRKWVLMCRLRCQGKTQYQRDSSVYK